MLRKVDKKTKERERERERVDLGFDRAIEMVKKEEVKEIKEAETMSLLLLSGGGGVVWSTTKKRLYESLRIRYGAVHLALVLHLEPAELIGRHLVPTVGELGKRFFHVRRWPHLAHLELPAEPQHLVLVARHFFYFYLKPNTLSLWLCVSLFSFYQREREIDVQFLINDICFGRVSERERARWAII